MNNDNLRVKINSVLMNLAYTSQLPDSQRSSVDELINHAKKVIEALITEQVRLGRIEELENMLKWNGSVIGINGLRVDNMVHHDVIKERLAQLKDTTKEDV